MAPHFAVGSFFDRLERTRQVERPALEVIENVPRIVSGSAANLEARPARRFRTAVNFDNSDSRAESFTASGGQKSENGSEMRLRRIGLPPWASRQAALVEPESPMIATDGRTPKARRKTSSHGPR